MAENARWYQSPHNPWEVVDEDGNTVAEVFGEDNELNERVRLFAAAPAMLAALEKVLEYEMSDWKSQQEFGGYVLDDDVRETVQQAIRLAKEGRK